jgi:hypothetical protein
MDWITQRLNLKNINVDLAKSVGKTYNIPEEDVMLVRKGLVPDDLKFEDGERAVISYITTATKDRDSEVVDPTGVILSDYRKHPVVLFCHDYTKLPIGKNVWIKQDEKGLIAKTVYAKHEEAEKVYQFRKDGFPLAESVGFVPLAWQDFNEGEKALNGGVNRKYTKWLMLEYSDVTVPSNPEAVQLAISKGILDDSYIKSNPTFDKYLLQPEVYEIKTTDEELKKDKEEELKVVEDISSTMVEAGENIIPAEEIAVPPVEEKIVEDVVEKTIDSQKNVSVFDILNAINRCCSDMESEYNDPMVVAQDNKRSCIGVDDLFPYLYPDGNVVISYYTEDRKREFFQCTYTYNDGDVELGEQVPVVQTYVPKTAETIEGVVEKSGRILSSKNIKRIESCVTQMAETIDILDGLLAEAKSETTDDVSTEEKKKEVTLPSDLEMKTVEDECIEIIDPPPVDNIIELNIELPVAKAKPIVSEPASEINLFEIKSFFKGMFKEQGQELKNEIHKELNETFEQNVRKARGKVY